MLELSTPELEPPKAALSPPQAEVPEDEEDYTGNEPEAEGDGKPQRVLVFHCWLLKRGAIPGKGGDCDGRSSSLPGSCNNDGNLHPHSSFHPRLS